MQSNLSRRQALQTAILLPLTAGLSMAAASGAGAQNASSNSRTLVAYFSRTGNTRVIAGQIRRALGADLFEIQPAEPYPEDYEATVSQVQREQEADYLPPLSQMVPAIGSYNVIFLGFPFWGMTAPPVIKSFLSGHELAGKTLAPFITHGGYGLGRSLAVVAEHAPEARLVEGFSKQADQERETLNEVTGWLEGVRVGE